MGWLAPFAAAASLALCVAGGAQLAQGLAVPVTAEVGQARLQSDFAQRLDAHGATRPDAAPGFTGRTEEAAAVPMRVSAGAGPAGAAPALFRLGIARLGVSEIVRSGEATHDRLARGPIMIKRGEAASPVTIVSAHRDTHFRFIRDLQRDDIVTLQTDTGDVERYRVTGFETVRWDRFRYPLDPSRPLLALATCYPFDGTEYGGPWRRVAWAEMLPDAPSE